MLKKNNSLLCLTTSELKELCKKLNFPEFRGKQISEWLYKKYQFDFTKMNNIPKEMRETLSQEYGNYFIKVVEEIVASDGTTKLLLELFDHETIEMVLIPSENRITFCLSTQVGCPVGCLFCASGVNGLVRNLHASEILNQFLIGCNYIGKLPDNVVFMGIGEGLLNFDALVKAINFMIDKDYCGLGTRRITVSTSGYVPGIFRLADLQKELNLAISLHAPNDEIREKIIPPNVRYSVNDIMNAADFYLEKCGRMVTLEYTLLSGINDSKSHAKELAILAKKHHAKINLIPYNETDSKFKRPHRDVIKSFLSVIERENAHVTIRQERGSKEAAACGQLRLNRSNNHV